MKVLIVGAGTVGQVYGYHLKKGGADVTFYVRPHAVEAARRGFTLYDLNQDKAKARPIRMSGYGVISTDAEAASIRWDYVFLCTHSDALKTPWFEGFARAVASATIVNLHPDLDAQDEVKRRFPPPQRVDGLIALIAFQAPLPGESVSEPGVAFWIPPRSQVPFRGPAPRVEPLIAHLRRGGFPCKRELQSGETRAAVAADIVLSIFVLALEATGWEFKKFVQKESLGLARKAILEAYSVQCHARGLGRPKLFPLKIILSDTGFRALLSLARRMIPFDLEVYLKVHFTKIRGQRAMGALRMIEVAKQARIETPALQKLAAQVGFIRL